MFNIESRWQWMALLALLIASIVRVAFHFFPSMTKPRRGVSPSLADPCGGCGCCVRRQDLPTGTAPTPRVNTLLRRSPP